MRYEPQGLDRWACPDLSAVRMRLHYRQRSGDEIAFSAYIYCLKLRDFAAADIIDAHTTERKRPEMPRFRKKPVVIEAVQNNSSLKPADLHSFLGDFEGVTVEGKCLVIKTLEGDMRADEGDWIIKGVKGEFYPCKPDIFAATYEPVTEGSNQ
jgi:hypothetical protein